MSLTINNNLGEWAATYPAAGNIFNQHNLDFCCGGKMSLQEACEKNRLDTNAIMNAILSQSASQQPLAWNDMQENELISNILNRFHQKHREDLQFLIPLSHKVESVHAANPDSPKGLTNFLQFLQQELEMHMHKEEQILFPMIIAGNGSFAGAPIQVMMEEHVEHGENLAKLKALTNNFVLPEGACGSWTMLYKRLSILDQELREHIATENNVLFPLVLKKAGAPATKGPCCGTCH